MADNLLSAMVQVFAPLSLMTIGGGQGVVAEIHRQVVDVHHWLTETQFLDDFAISRLAPGPGSLLVTLIGWHIAGVLGAIVATLSIFGPTALLIYAVAHVWSRYRGARLLIALEAGLRPVAAGLVLAAVWVLMLALKGGWIAEGVALASTAALMATRINPLILIACGAALFVGLSQVGAL
ncbi:MAG: chromate transporter [Rhodobacteraceae bacterium]|nr:chromate transporter [Paracoccaceae bacterium]